MLKNAQYIYDNIIKADEINTTKKWCKKAQVGVDLSIKSIQLINQAGKVFVDKTIAPQYTPVEIGDIGEGRKGWFLPQGTYICDLNEGCSFGERDTGLIILRSSLNRSGVTICSAVWDPGYTSVEKDSNKVNSMSIRMIVDNREGFWLEANARIAQLIVFESEPTNLYNGQWQGGLKQSKLVEK